MSVRIAQVCTRIVVQTSDNRALNRKFKSTGHARADQLAHECGTTRRSARASYTSRARTFGPGAGTCGYAAELGFY
jgi:hypothetical protein